MANNGIATTDHSIEPIAPFTRSPIATSSNLGEARGMQATVVSITLHGRSPSPYACLHNSSFEMFSGTITQQMIQVICQVFFHKNLTI
ncbi:hypothetical protein QUB10_15980 [Microcoleus sp. B5-D4]|uniref:hypothetical protein n=1 Tax=unclassified Microcoleus TaxID=2642155 RepID=UPI002FD1E90B